MLDRLNRPIYYCYRLQPQDEGYQEGIETFSPPVKRYLHYRSISGEAVLLAGGELSEKRLVSKVSSFSADKYFENDRLFINKSPPGEFDPIDPGANYRIVSVSVNPNVTEIIFEQMAEG